MKKVTFRGTGQLNGPRIIDKVLEVENQVAIDLLGRNRDRVILALLAVHYAGVEINPRKMGISIDTLDNKNDYNEAINFLKKTKPKSFKFSSIFLWIIFFPFKLLWWILKAIWKD